MTNREQVIDYLTSWPITMTREKAEARLVDDDLWIVEPDLRADLQGEEAVREWEGAVAFISAITEGFAYASSGSLTGLRASSSTTHSGEPRKPCGVPGSGPRRR